MRRPSRTALVMRVALSGLVGCKTLFGVEEPPLLTDSTLPTCAESSGSVEGASTPPTFVPIAGFGIFPMGGDDPDSGSESRIRNHLSVEHAAVLPSMLALANDQQVFVVDRSALFGGGDGGPPVHSLTSALRNPPSARDTGRTVYGLTRSEPLGYAYADSGGPTPALYALLCRWQQGCSLEYATEATLREALGAQGPAAEASAPCQDDSGQADLKGGLGYGCFPFAAPVEGSGFLYGARPVGNDVALCATQGTGGTEDRAKSIVCRVGRAQADGGRVGDLDKAGRQEVALDQSDERPTALGLDPFEPMDGSVYPRIPMRLVTHSTLYFANTIGTGSQVQELTDGLLDMPPRTITAYDLQPNVTWLAVERSASGETWAEFWRVQPPRLDSDQKLRVVVDAAFSRKGKVLALVYAPAREQLYWVEEAGALGQRTERALFQASALVPPLRPEGSCARALPEPGTSSVPRGLNTRNTSVRLFIPPADRNHGCPEHDELYVLAAKNFWGRPSGGALSACAPLR